ncbi:MAG: hypothetical protein M3Y55_15935 [Pseudomonadota bacterium]|nr:hypothetical protein [Pseudomonadota bacterium]
MKSHLWRATGAGSWLPGEVVAALLLTIDPATAAWQDKPPRRSHPRVRERGQALTEFLVAAIALVPLFLLIPLIAKYQDISHATQMASRYVAFDAFTHNDSLGTPKPEGQLADEVRRRFFGNADSPIKTNDVAGNFLADHNLFWRDPNGDVLIKDFSNDVTVSYGPANASAHGNGFTAASDGTPFVPLHDQLGLRARGLYTVNVSVALANMPAGLSFYEPFDKIDLSIARSTSVAIDPWTARNPQEVEGKIAANPLIFPVGSLAAVSPVVDGAVTAIDAPGIIRGPRLGQLDFWRDVVPQDRLQSGR